MSIASEITRITDNVADAYTAANAKGATMPVTQNSDNLASTIATIPTGTTPTGSVTITNNGTYDVTDKATAVVAVPTSGPDYYIERTVDANGKLQRVPVVLNLNGVTDVGPYALAHAYANYSTYITGAIDLSDLQKITGNRACENMFYWDYNITSVDMRNVTEISWNNACTRMFYYSQGMTSFNLDALTKIENTEACSFMFAECIGLLTANFPALELIDGIGACSSTFQNCTSLISANFPVLQLIKGNNVMGGTFSGCRSLTTIKMNKLENIRVQISPSYAPIAKDCKALESFEFGGLKSTTFATARNQLQYLFNNTVGSTAPNGCTVHFPSNFDPSDPNHTFDASTLVGYPTFGGDAQYIHVAFDMPATE